MINVAVPIVVVFLIVHDATKVSDGDRVTKDLAAQVEKDNEYFNKVYIPAQNQWVTHWNNRLQATDNDEKIIQLNECISSLERIGSADSQGVSSDLVETVSKWQVAARELSKYELNILKAWFPDTSKKDEYHNREKDAEIVVQNLMVKKLVWGDKQVLKTLKEAIDKDPAAYFANEQAVKDKIAKLK